MLEFQLNPESSEPLYLQLFNALRDAIEDGSLAPGKRLPASRTLAEELDVSRSVVISAYQLLTASQLVWARVGSGTYVRPADRWRESVGRDSGEIPVDRVGPTPRKALPAVGGSARWNRPAAIEHPEWIVFGLDPELLERRVK
jgi:GntR family transcriptional regulator/MocR family aminotransferase